MQALTEQRFYSYCMSKNSCPFVYIACTMKVGQAFLNWWYPDFRIQKLWQRRQLNLNSTWMSNKSDQSYTGTYYLKLCQTSRTHRNKNNISDPRVNGCVPPRFDSWFVLLCQVCVFCVCVCGTGLILKESGPENLKPLLFLMKAIVITTFLL